MTIDVANKNNISLQQQCKKQAMQLNVSRVDFYWGIVVVLWRTLPTTQKNLFSD